jgi:UDP-N-acetylmuramoyl-L-alanyl-D-glutamate--2,6-diaminopimelate ligase
MSDLITGIEPVAVRGDPATTEVTSVEFDSRAVRVGSLFCCVPGAHTDGHLHAAAAVAAGARSLLCEHLVDQDVAQVVVASGQVRPAMAEVASAFYGHPSRSMTMVGVTGTNGKTTVTHLVRAVLECAGRSAATVGTLDGARTTPEAPDLHRRLAALRDQGVQAVAMEVSSHALDQQRVDGITFEVGAFTNLSRDHLDHHRSMEAYFAAKARLFEPGRVAVAVIATDDPYGRRLADTLLARGQRVVPVQRSDASEVALSVGRSTFSWRGHQVALPLSGAFNVDNALMAASVALTLGVAEADIVAGLAGAPPVPGRMEVVTAGPPFAVLVDYAHTPAGVAVALAAARTLAGGGRVICVMGAGGDRDRGKRAQMGAAASEGADLVVLTSDNPRSEDASAIIDEVRAGVRGSAELVVEPDRAEAIGQAVGRAAPGDVVMVVGKGHETSQVLADREIPFDDRVEAARAVDRLADRPDTGHGLAHRPDTGHGLAHRPGTGTGQARPAR